MIASFHSSGTLLSLPLRSYRLEYSQVQEPFPILIAWLQAWLPTVRPLGSLPSHVASPDREVQDRGDWSIDFHGFLGLGQQFGPCLLSTIDNELSSSRTPVNWSFPLLSFFLAILKPFPCLITSWIVSVLCFLRPRSCFVVMVLFSSAVSTFSRAYCEERFSMNSLFASSFIYSFQIFALTMF